MSKFTLIRGADQNQLHGVARPSLLPVAAVAFVTAITGTAIGFVTAFSIAMPMMRQALASEVSGANARLASSISPDGEECIEVAPSGEVLGAETASAAPIEQVPGSQNNQSNVSNNTANNINKINKTFINKLVGGQFVNNTAVIKNTGPNSSNEIVTKNIAVTKVTNTNDIKVSSTNNQYATSGSANVSDNTNGGSASTGSSDNSNDTSLALTINN